MVTIYDIAKKANVSAMTVSRVINNKGRISEKTRAKVKRIMEELNYVPNEMARSLVLRETQVLFLLITDIMNPFFTTLARGAEDAANKQGYRVLFGNSDESLDKEREYVDTLLKSRVDGVLLAPAGDHSLPQLETLRAHNVPFVLLDREVPGIQSDVVLGDSKEGTRMLMEHMIALGHTDIALVNGGSEVSSARLRAAGYREALKLNDLPCEEERVLELDYAPRSGSQRIALWLQSLAARRPTAIMCGNNMLAIQTVQAIRSCGLQVPQDISVVCFDDLGPVGEIDPFLTVAAQQAYQFGYTGTQLLIERIMNREEEQPFWKRIVLPAELVVRRSVADLTQRG
ncbi:MAG: LacI family transcriptional regulator [Paenibacillaceae bacterium]|jgi:LacI family transcriptional regulator|nr:LacI family transcriptional regulator [Paenibacillaceae bacterium]